MKRSNPMREVHVRCVVKPGVFIIGQPHVLCLILTVRSSRLSNLISPAAVRHLTELHGPVEGSTLLSATNCTS